MTTSASEVLASRQAEWEENGFFRVNGFASPDTCRQMLDEVEAMVLAAARGEQVPGYVLPEAAKQAGGHDPRRAVSKVFRLHRHGTFRAFATDAGVLDLVEPLVAPELDVFLSQFVFKAPGAWGQPWHQDSFYFPFDPPRPVVGVWLAVTPATLANGCLHVVPGSHREALHEHVPDARPGANYGYVEIVDHDMSGAVPVLMEPGDLLVFDSHLMHRSTDNLSDSIRGAMVYHYAAAGTTELTPSSVNDWMPARRAA